MPCVLIAIGSNCQQSVYVQWASERLAMLLEGVQLSRRIWTHDLKGSGSMYLNRLTAGVTTLSADELQRYLKACEAEVHRTKNCVTLDLDLMLYDTDRYHERDWKRPYIQQLINDIQL